MLVPSPSLSIFWQLEHKISQSNIVFIIRKCLGREKESNFIPIFYIKHDFTPFWKRSSKILFLFPSKALFNINRQLFVVNHNFGLTLFRKSLEKVNFNFPIKKQLQDGQKIASIPHQETIHRDKTYSINRRELLRTCRRCSRKFKISRRLPTLSEAFPSKWCHNKSISISYTSNQITLWFNGIIKLLTTINFFKMLQF